MAANPNKTGNDPANAGMKYRQNLANRRAQNPSGSTLPPIQYEDTAGGRSRQRTADYRASGKGNKPVPPENNAVDRTRNKIRERRQQMG
jgi:hypothetical protein